MRHREPLVEKVHRPRRPGLFRRAEKELPLKAPRSIGLVIVLLSGVLCALFLLSDGARTSYPLDDAWIHMVYARNLAAGHFFSYNPPDPEAGFTSPLWLLPMAAIQLFTEHVLVPKIAGFLLLILLAWIAVRLGGSAAGVLILLDPLMQFTALSGMEVIPFTLAALLALERHLAGRPLQAGLAAAGALLLRPEGALLGLLLPALALRRGEAIRATSKRCMLLTLPGLAAALLWMAFCLFAAGRPFPNTFYAKWALPWTFPLEALGPWDSVRRFALDGYRFLADAGPPVPFVAAVLIPGAFLLSRGRKTAALFFLSAGLFTGVWFTRPVLVVEAFYWERYLLPALAVLHVLMGIGFHALWNRSGPYRVAAGLAGLALLAGFGFSLPEKLERYEQNCRDIARFNVDGGRWVAAHTDPADRIAVLDAGAIKYFGRREVIDLVGLNAEKYSDPSWLENLARQGIDVSDPVALADHGGAEWLLIFEWHYWERGNYTLWERYDFTCVDKISYNDYSFLYLQNSTPPAYAGPFSLLMLKKKPINGLK